MQSIELFQIWNTLYTKECIQIRNIKRNQVTFPVPAIVMTPRQPLLEEAWRICESTFWKNEWVELELSSLKKDLRRPEKWDNCPVTAAPLSEVETTAIGGLSSELSFIFLSLSAQRLWTCGVVFYAKSPSPTTSSHATGGACHSEVHVSSVNYYGSVYILISHHLSQNLFTV